MRPIFAGVLAKVNVRSPEVVNVKYGRHDFNRTLSAWSNCHERVRNEKVPEGLHIFLCESGSDCEHVVQKTKSAK